MVFVSVSDYQSRSCCGFGTVSSFHFNDSVSETATDVDYWLLFAEG